MFHSRPESCSHSCSGTPQDHPGFLPPTALVYAPVPPDIQGVVPPMPAMDDDPFWPYFVINRLLVQQEIIINLIYLIQNWLVSHPNECISSVSLVFKGPVHATKKKTENQTDLDWTASCGCITFWMEGPCFKIEPKCFDSLSGANALTSE